MRQMKELKEVELVAIKAEDSNTWHPEGRFLTGIMRDFKGVEEK